MANMETGFPRFEGETDKEYYARLDAALDGDDYEDPEDCEDAYAIDNLEPCDFEDDNTDAANDFDEFLDVWDWNDGDYFLEDLEESVK